MSFFIYIRLSKNIKIIKAIVEFMKIKYSNLKYKVISLIASLALFGLGCNDSKVSYNSKKSLENKDTSNIKRINKDLAKHSPLQTQPLKIEEVKQTIQEDSLDSKLAENKDNVSQTQKTNQEKELQKSTESLWICNYKVDLDDFEVKYDDKKLEYTNLNFVKEENRKKLSGKCGDLEFVLIKEEKDVKVLLHNLKDNSYKNFNLDGNEVSPFDHIIKPVMDLLDPKMPKYFSEKKVALEECLEKLDFEKNSEVIDALVNGLYDNISYFTHLLDEELGMILLRQNNEKSLKKKISFEKEKDFQPELKYGIGVYKTKFGTPRISFGKFSEGMIKYRANVFPDSGYVQVASTHICAEGYLHVEMIFDRMIDKTPETKNPWKLEVIFDKDQKYLSSTVYDNEGEQHKGLSKDDADKLLESPLVKTLYDCIEIDKKSD